MKETFGLLRNLRGVDTDDMFRVQSPARLRAFCSGCFGAWTQLSSEAVGAQGLKASKILPDKTGHELIPVLEN